MSRTKHTSLPWRLPNRSDDYDGACILDHAGYLVADCNIVWGDRELSQKECQANANFIITACNSHYELLAACEAAAVIVPMGSVLSQLVKAIEKAENSHAQAL